MMEQKKVAALASAIAATLGAGSADAGSSIAALKAITVYGGSGSSALNVTSSTATWSYDNVAHLLTQTGGTFNARFTIAPTTTVFRHVITGLVIGNGAAASASTYQCLEGNFGSALTASICGNYNFGVNFINESTTTWGPGTAYNRTIGGDDVVLGTQQHLNGGSGFVYGGVGYDGFTVTSWVGTTLILSNASCNPLSPGNANGCAAVGGFNAGYRWTLDATPAPIKKVLILNNASDLIETRYIENDGRIQAAILDTTPTGDGPCSMTFSNSGRTVYVGNCGDGTVQAFARNLADDDLTVLGSSVSTGFLPVSLTVDPSGTRLIVVSSTGSSVSIDLNADTGELISQPVATNATPGLVSVTPATGLGLPAAPTANDYVYVTNQDVGGTISRYGFNASTGVISLSGSNGFAGAGLGASLAAAVLPSGFVYLSGGSPDFKISALRIDPQSGVLTGVTGSPFNAANGSFDLTALAADPGGDFLYVGYAADSKIAAYRMDPATGALTLLLGGPFAVAVAPDAITFDPSGTYAFVCGADGSGVGHVQAYAVNRTTGALTAIGTALPTGGTGGKILVAPSSKTLYVANRFGLADQSVSGTIGAFSIDPNTGALTALSGSPYLTTGTAGIAATDIAISPYETFAYVVRADNHVAAYAIDPEDGDLSEAAVPGSPFTTASNAGATLAIDPDGKFVYVYKSVSGSSSISAYSINPDGSLEEVTGTPFSAPDGPAKAFFITR